MPLCFGGWIPLASRHPHFQDDLRLKQSRDLGKARQQWFSRNQVNNGRIPMAPVKLPKKWVFSNSPKNSLTSTIWGSGKHYTLHCLRLCLRLQWLCSNPKTIRHLLDPWSCHFLTWGVCSEEKKSAYKNITYRHLVSIALNLWFLWSYLSCPLSVIASPWRIWPRRHGWRNPWLLRVRTLCGSVGFVIACWQLMERAIKM